MCTKCGPSWISVGNRSSPRGHRDAIDIIVNCVFGGMWRIKEEVQDNIILRLYTYLLSPKTRTSVFLFITPLKADVGQNKIIDLVLIKWGGPRSPVPTTLVYFRVT